MCSLFCLKDKIWLECYIFGLLTGEAGMEQITNYVFENVHLNFSVIEKDKCAWEIFYHTNDACMKNVDIWFRYFQNWFHHLIYTTKMLCVRWCVLHCMSNSSLSTFVFPVYLKIFNYKIMTDAIILFQWFGNFSIILKTTTTILPNIRFVNFVWHFLWCKILFLEIDL